MRNDLLAWQWSDYASRHRSRTNLLVHAVAVPLFQLACVAIAFGAITGAWAVGAVGAAALLVSMVAQGRGHRSEPEAPVPFDGPADFVSRFLAEQWVTFPRFVLSGGWWRNMTAGRKSGPLLPG